METNPYGQPEVTDAPNPYGQPEIKPSGFLRKAVADKAVGFASGAVGATKALADAAGAGNVVSNTLKSANTGINDYLSPEAKAEQQARSARTEQAKGTGLWNEFMTGAQNFAESPIQQTVTGVGSVVPVALAAIGGLPAAAATGIGMGVGTVKGRIYDDTKKRGVDAGLSAPAAEADAAKAQNYTGENADQIAFGGALGAVDALTGVGRIAGGALRNAVMKPAVSALPQAVERGIVGRAAMGALGEVPLEAAQGGQEQLATNIAAQRQGVNVDTWAGVAGQATEEGLASLGAGAGAGALHSSAKVSPDAAPSTEVAPASPTLQIGNTPDPLLSFPDGTVARRSEVDAHIASLPPEQQPSARAKIMGLAPQPAIPEAAPGTDVGIPITETAVAPIKPSEAMGLDPAAGPLSAAAVTAVDTGAHQPAVDTAAAMATYRAETEALRQQQEGQDAAELAQAQRAEEEQAQAKTQADIKAMLDRATAPVDLTADELFPAPASTDKPGSFTSKLKEAKAKTNNHTDSVGGSSTTLTPVQLPLEKQQNQPSSLSVTAQSATENVATKSETPDDIATREWAANYSKVTGDIASATDKDIERADGYAAKLISGYQKSAFVGDQAAKNMIASISAEQAGFMQELQRRKTALNQPVAHPESAPTVASVATVTVANTGKQPTDAPSLTKKEQAFAAGNAGFATPIKAQQFIAANGLKATHQAIKTSATRWDVKAKDSQPQGNTNEPQADQAIKGQAKQQTPERAAGPQVATDGITPAISALRAKAHNNTPKNGPRGDVRLSSHTKGANYGEWVSFDDAVAAAREAVASGVRPVPFQIHDALDVNIGDTNRIIAALSAPTAKPVTTQVAPAAVKPKPASLKQRMEQERSARADYFTPGNIVASYGGHDEVLSYTPPDAKGQGWSVKVRAVVKQDGRWVPDPKDNRERSHSTQPEARGLDKGPVERAKMLVQASAKPEVTAPVESPAETDHPNAESPEDDIVIKPGKGFIKDKFLSEVDRDGAPGGPFESEDAAREAAEAWRAKKADRATESAAERTRRDAMAEKIKAGTEPTAGEIKSLDLAVGESDIRWFFPTAANLFGITSRQIRPIVADVIRVSQNDMGTKRELVPTKKALMLIGRSLVAVNEAKPSEPAEAAQTTQEKPAKIEDIGQVLEGARKLYAKNYAAKMDEGMGMDTAAVPLSKSWPEPDYRRLLDEGTDPWAVAMAHAMRDEIPNKPSSWKLKGWVQTVEALRDMAAKVMSGEMTQEKLKTTGGQYNLADWFNKIDLYEAVGHGESLKGVKFSKADYSMYAGQHFSPAKTMWSITEPSTSASSTWSHGNWGNVLAIADTKEEAIAKFKDFKAQQVAKPAAEAKGTAFDIYSYRSKPGVFIIGKRLSASKSIDLKTFPSAKEAREYKANNQNELEKLLEAAKVVPSERRESNAPRVGVDHRNGTDVTTEQFRDTFGFRGEQFGASMPQGERQANLNQAFDALMDLAGVVGVPPKALSLNGELGLAFGARGHGGKGAFAAHYERDTTGAVTPNRVVINLTRKSGAGSLAHEWFHGVDNYFARMRGEKAGMLTDKPYELMNKGVRPEMIEAFKGLMKTINLSGLKARSQVLDNKRVKEYWTTGIEMAARSFESYVIAKLQDQNASNDYLANIVNESLYAMQGAYPYPSMGEMPQIRAAFDHFFDTVQTKDTEQGVAMFSARDSAPEKQLPLEQIERLVKSALRGIVGSVPIRVVANPEAIGLSVPANNVASGVTFTNGDIYVFQSGVSSALDVDKVIFHELFHKGLQNVIAPADYVASMLELAAGDSRVQQYSNDWKASNMAGSQKAGLVAKGYTGSDLQGRFEALAIEEGLAQVAEDLKAERQMGTKAMRVRRLAAWLAKLADKMGMTRMANAIRAMSYTDAEKFVVETISKAGGTAPGKVSLSQVSNGDASAEEAAKVQAGIEGKSLIEAARFIQQTGGKAHSEVATKVLAKLMQLRANGVNLGLIVAHRGDSVPVDMINSRGYTELAFDEKGHDITVWINGADIAGKVGVDFETVLHELVHAATMGAVMHGQYNPNSSIGKSIHDLNAVSDAIGDHISARFTAANAGTIDLTEFEKDIQAGANNAFTNTHEVVTWALTSKDAQAYLESIPYKGDSMWTAFVQAVRTALGLEASADTALSEILRVSEAILNAQDEKTSGTKAFWHKRNIRMVPQQAKGSIVLKQQDTYNMAGVGRGNDGATFSAKDDVRYRSLGDTLKQATVTDLTHRFGNRLSDFRSLGLQTLGLAQLVDVYTKDLPALKPYQTMVRQMDADKNESGAEADALATGWGKLKDERQLAELMHDATLAQIDPDKAFATGDDRNFYDALKAGFDGLTPEAKKAYREARDMYSVHNDKVRQAIQDRIMRSELSPARKKALLERMDGEFFKQVKGVYFPLARFGQYVTIVKDGAGNVVSANRSETMNEAEATRKTLQREFPVAGGFKVGKVLKDREFNAARDGVGRGFMADLFETLEKTGADEELQDAISQLYLAALPDLSWAKHGIHRKGTPGFSQDARRAFAQNMFHGARYLAKLRYADQLQTGLDTMQEHIGKQSENDAYDSVKAQQVVDEMVKRHESMMNPQTNPLSTALTSFGFVFHLGLSPASALVNLLQTALVAYPVMGAKWGFGKASAELMTASKQAASNKNDISTVLTGDERAAYDEAVRSGVIDVTMAHDLAGIAQGEDSKISAKIRPVMKAASFLFHHAEKFNRQVTFVAAYRLAREADPKTTHLTAYDQAVKATYDGHFDYSASNRPRVMQGNVAKVVLLFKQYSQNMIYTLTRQAQQAIKAETPEGRKEARKALAGLLVSHAMAAGVFGLPVVGMLFAAASSIGGDDDEPWDAEVAFKNMLADAFTPKVAEVVAHGLSRLTPWDLSGRVGLDRLLLPDVQEGLHGTRAAESWSAQALGPVAGIGINAFKGLSDMADGNYVRGLESMLPAALRGPLKAYRFKTEGNIDKSGVVINDEVSLAGVAGQALGFSPSETRLAQEGKSAIYSADRAIQERRSSLVRQYALAAMAGDEEGKADARKDISRFNEKNPGSRITPNQLMRSVMARRKRIAQAEQGVYLPRERRGAMEAGSFAETE